MTHFRRGIGVFLFSAAFLLLELTLTRIFSVITFYHYAYMAITLALFGMAFGGVLIFIRPSLVSQSRTDEQLAILAALYAVFTFVALGIISNTNFDPFLPVWPMLGNLLLLFLICMLPFMIAGVILSVVFMRYRERIGTMYAANLVGSGIGCLLVIPAMDLLGGPTTVIAAAFIASCAAVVFQPPRLRTRSYGYALLALILLALTIINPTTHQVDLRYSKGKDTREADVIYSRWNSFSRILVIRDYPKFLGLTTGARELLEPRQAFRFYNWGLSSKYNGPIVDGRSLLIDDLAGSPLIHFDGDLSKLEFLRYDITSLGYYLKQNQKPNVLIIGPGGGRDVLTALYLGAGNITGVEINPIIIDVTQNVFADFTGRPYSQPNVNLQIDEGRNFISRSKDKYDIIQIPLVDTWAATASGAFSLSENTLYTVEAFAEYFGHLKPDGILAISHYHFEPPKQTLRMLSLFRKYCEDRGIEHPERKCAVIAFTEYHLYNVATVIMKRDDLTIAEMRTLRDVSDEMGYKVLWMPDGGEYVDEYSKLLMTDDFEGYLAGYPFDVTPTTDDRPFFFHLVRPGEFYKAISISDESGQPYNYMAIFTLMVLLFMVIFLTITGIFLPLFITLRRRRVGLDNRRVNLLFYFALIGVAFMLFEIAMIQKFILFLGPPIYSLAVVLFSLLVFTGIGAWLSDRIARNRPTLKPAVFIIALSAVIVIFAFFLTPLFNALIGLPILLRCTLAVMLLAPLGLLLGFPFPLGIRLLGLGGEDLIPYAYGLNGAFSVLGSVVALILALTYGFTFNVFIAVALYLLAAVASRNNPTKSPITTNPITK